MKKELKIEDFSPSLFWDVDKTQLDFEKNAMHVVEKALSRGSWEDFKTALAYYGRERFIALVKNIRYLDRRTEQFSSIYFEIPLTRDAMLYLATVEPVTLGLLKRLMSDAALGQNRYPGTALG